MRSAVASSMSGLQDQAVRGVKLLIEGVSHGVFREGDKGVLLDLGEGNLFSFQIGVVAVRRPGYPGIPLTRVTRKSGILPDRSRHDGKVRLTGLSDLPACLGVVPLVSFRRTPGYCR